MKKSLIFVVLILAACRGQEDIKLETAAKIYVENLAIEEKYAERPDTMLMLKNKLFDKYKLPKEEYTKIFDNLGADKGKWEEFFSYSEKFLDSLKERKKLN